MPTLAHISDLHFGTERPEIAAALREELQARPPTLVVVSGDLTQRARTRQFAAAADYLRTLPGPQLIVPGNHDVPLFDVARRFLAPLARYRRHIGEGVDPVWEGDDLLVVGLNTARSLTWKSGRISREQIDWLEERLTGARARHKVVVTHHPFIPPPARDSDQAGIRLVGRAALAMAVIDRCGVDLLLSGHLHHGYSGDTRTQYPAARRGVVAVQAGTAISGRVRSDPNGYNRILLAEDRMSVEVRTWRDGAFTTLQVAEYRRGETGWQAAAG
ncbi:MAG TPA: metallophosphoesterase family protein [Opitutaceae bacterium]|nr:metallophosphoesterase family protein [Opitutaceae bacterium]